MILIPADKQGEAVVSALVIAAALLKLVSDRAKKKVEEEADEPNPPEDEVEVIKKKDFDLLVQQVTLSVESAAKAKNAFEDTLACITIINILLQILGADSRKLLLKAAEEQVYIFIRHTDFPSRIMITTMFEAAVKDINDGLDEQITKEKELNK